MIKIAKTLKENKTKEIGDRDKRKKKGRKNCDRTVKGGKQ